MPSAAKSWVFVAALPARIMALDENRATFIRQTPLVVVGVVVLIEIDFWQRLEALS